jgi:hypothetical protein
MSAAERNSGHFEALRNLGLLDKDDLLRRRALLSMIRHSELPVSNWRQELDR